MLEALELFQRRYSLNQINVLSPQAVYKGICVPNQQVGPFSSMICCDDGCDTMPGDC